MAGNYCPFLIRGVRRIHGLEGPAHLAASGTLQEQIQLLQAGTRDSSRDGREGKPQSKEPSKCQHLVWLRLCPGLIFISMDLGQKFLVLTQRSFLPCFQKIHFCSLQPCLSQLSTHIHFVSRLSWLQQHSGIFGHFWSHILHHKAGVSLRAAGDLHPCLRQLHLLPLEMNSGKTRHFANYEICVK